jgi:DNA-directed RNA polymerase specialized sigma54-like protein
MVNYSPYHSRGNAMPLEPGKSREVVSRNISEMIRASHPRKQAVAAALDKAGRSKARRTLGKKRKKMKHPELRGRVLPV